MTWREITVLYVLYNKIFQKNLLYLFEKKYFEILFKKWFIQTENLYRTHTEISDNAFGNPSRIYELFNLLFRNLHQEDWEIFLEEIILKHIKLEIIFNKFIKNQILLFIF